MSTFTPPVIQDRPAFNPDSSEAQKGLFKYMPLGYRYAAVFQLSDGTFVQDTATAENKNTSIPYPWDPSNPDKFFARAVYTDLTLNPPQLVIDDTVHTVWITRVFLVPTVVTSAEVALLTAAGYGGNIT